MIMTTRLHLILAIQLLLVSYLLAKSLKYKPHVSTRGNENKAFNDLVRRVVGERSSEFEFSVDATLRASRGLSDNDTHVAKIENLPNNHIHITASSGVAGAWALNYYLRKFGKCHISWDERQVETLPKPLPAVPPSGIDLQSRYQYIYMGNPCVFSYSMPFWNWTHWEPFIDWLALNGINLFLMPVGYETALFNTYRYLGLDEAEAASFFVGPAFQAWFEMGNIRNFSGALTKSWFEVRRQLGIQILSRMHDLQMRAVLPAFNGLVPPQIARIYPGVLLEQMRWIQFDTAQNQYFLSVYNSSIYATIINAYFKQAALTFGESVFANVNMFLIDSFNEMGVPFDGSASFVAAYATLVSQTMAAWSNNYVWVVQGWMLQGWDVAHAHALLSSVPYGRLLMLDLWAEASPVYAKFGYFGGHRFVWCMLHDFGGANGMFGNLDAISPGPQLLLNRPNVSLAGIGLTMEGFYQNYVLYQLMLDNAYPDSPMTNVTDWSDWLSHFAEQRYGILSYSDPQYADLLRGWLLAASTAYTTAGGGGITHQGDDPYIRYMETRPSYFFSTASQSENGGTYRDRTQSKVATAPPHLDSKVSSADYLDQLFEAWKFFLNVPSWLTSTSAYQHDLVDLTRQTLSALFKNQFDLLQKEFSNLTAPDRYFRVLRAGENLLDILQAIDVILGTHRAFMIGPWIDKAAAWNGIMNLTVFNAKSQLTTWGDSPCCYLMDYSGKQWNGLVQAYYLPRVTLFLERLLSCVIQGRSWSKSDSDSYNLAVNQQVELPFGRSSANFPSVPLADPHATSSLLYEQFSQFRFRLH